MNATDEAARYVLIESLCEHVAVVTLARPETLNAVNGRMALELERAVKTTEFDPGVWVVILTGSGDKAFCAGGDLKEMAAGRFSSLWTCSGGFAGFVNSRRTKV